MTLNHSEWLEWQFTLNFHYYVLPLTIVIYLFTVESVYIRVTSGDAGSGVSDRDPQNIWNPRKTAIFRRRYIVGTLTNKVNISI